MKNGICVLLAVFLLALSLTACTMPENPQPPVTVLPSGPVAELGDTQGWVMAGRQDGAFSNEGYYYLKSGNFLMFADRRTGASVCLCSKPGCRHWMEDGQARENCDANIKGYDGPIFYVADCLYYVTLDSYGKYLKQRDAAGFSEKTIGALGKQYTEDEKIVSITNMCPAEGYIYYDATVSALVWDPATETSVVKEVGYYIAKVNLKSGKEDILLETGERNPIQICAVRSGGVLYCQWQIPEVEYENPEYTTALMNQTYTLNYWDLGKNQTAVVLQKLFRDCQGVMQVHSGKIYYQTNSFVSTTTYAYDMKTGVETQISENALRHMGGGYALESQNGQRVILNMHTGQRLPFTLQGNKLSIAAFSDQCCVVQNWSDIQNGEQKRTLCIISYADLADGLQESDLLAFETESSIIQASP